VKQGPPNVLAFVAAPPFLAASPTPYSRMNFQDM